MRLFFTILILLVTLKLSCAQQEEIHLKNGSIIRGFVVEQIPTESVKIQTRDGSLLVYPINDVVRIVKLGSKQDFNKRSNLSTGYRGIAEFGYAFGVGGNAADRIIINSIHGYQFNPDLFVGAGIGGRYYSDASTFAIPVFTDFKFNFIDSKASPYIGLSLGYSFNASSNLNGIGLFFSPSIGINLNLKEKSIMHIAVGCEMQKEKIKYSYSNYYNTNYYSYLSSEALSAITLQFAVSF